MYVDILTGEKHLCVLYKRKGCSMKEGSIFLI